MGWQKVPFIYTCLSATLCLALIGLLIGSSVIGDFYGSTILHEGECRHVGKLDWAFHAVATITSFLVTMSSDAFLRIIVAPLPKDIDRAHANAEWLEIGVNSWRNLKYIASWRRVFWALLLLSSIPLQLLFQSAIFTTTTSTDYNQIVVNEDFLHDGPWAVPGVAYLLNGMTWVDDNATIYAAVQSFQQYSTNSNWTKLDSITCRETYVASANGLQQYRNLIIVIQAGPDPSATGWTDAQVWSNALPNFYENISTTSYSPGSLNTLWYQSFDCKYGLECQAALGYGDVDLFFPEDDVPTYFPDPWTFPWVSAEAYVNDPTVANFSKVYNTVTLEYCLAEPFISPCKIGITNGFLLAVCICVGVKSIVAALTLTWLKGTTPIQCIGDLIQHQMKAQDTATVGLCTYDQGWFRKFNPKRIVAESDDMEPRWVASPRKWSSTGKRWRDAVPKRVLWATYFSICSVLLVSVVLLGIGLNYNSFRGNPWSEAGFGDNPNNSQLHLFGTRVSSAIVANIPQAILTACYFWFTGVYARLFQARDWANFAESPQRLKVSAPIRPNRVPLTWCGLRVFRFKTADEGKPNQNSNYVLGIPFWWGLLFAICSAGLHWMISQSLYVVAKEVLPADSSDTYEVGLTWSLNFSTEALISTLVLAILTVSVPIMLSLRRLPANSIVVGTNSAAISAQCHRARHRGLATLEEGKAAGVDVVELKHGDNMHDNTDRHDIREIDPGHHDVGGANGDAGGTEVERPRKVGRDDAVPKEQDAAKEGEAQREEGTERDGAPKQALAEEMEGNTQAEVTARNEAEAVAGASSADKDEAEQGQLTNSQHRLDDDHKATEPNTHYQKLHPEKSHDNDASQAFWLRDLQWGVLLTGSEDKERPGQLGLALAVNVLGKPENRRYYM